MGIDPGLNNTGWGLIESLPNNEKYLSIKNLKKLARLPNVTIGAHSFSHISLTDCDDSKLKIELTKELKPVEWIEVESLTKPETNKPSTEIAH